MNFLLDEASQQKGVSLINRFLISEILLYCSVIRSNLPSSLTNAFKVVC